MRVVLDIGMTQALKSTPDATIGTTTRDPEGNTTSAAVLDHLTRSRARVPNDEATLLASHDRLDMRVPGLASRRKHSAPMIEYLSFTPKEPGKHSASFD